MLQYPTLSIESQHSLNGHVNAMKLVLLEHDFCDLLSVLGGVHGWLCQQDLQGRKQNPVTHDLLMGLNDRVSSHLALRWVDVQAVGAKGVVPQVEHVFPAAHHSVLHGVGHLQHGAALAGLIAHHQVLVLMQKYQHLCLCDAY